MKAINVWDVPKCDGSDAPARQDDPFSWLIRKRLKEKRNTMCASLGEPRVGKSDSQKMIGEMNDINEDFDHTHMTFLPQTYLDRLRKSPPGCYIVFDEPGAEWSSRRFMGIVNLLLGATHITMGSRLINVGWAVPVLKMQDVNAARLLKYFFIMQTAGPRGMAWFYKNWVSQYTGKTGRTQLGTVRFNKGFARRPEEDEAYEKEKKDYQDSSYEEYYIRFEEEQSKKQSKKKVDVKDFNELVKKVLEDSSTYMLKGRLRTSLIETKEGVRPSTANRIRDVVQQELNKRKLSEPPIVPTTV